MNAFTQRSSRLNAYRIVAALEFVQIIHTRPRQVILSVDAVHQMLDAQVALGMTTFIQFERFLRILYRFHHEIDPLYDRPPWCDLAPELQRDSQHVRIGDVLHDLRMAVPQISTAQLRGVTWPQAMGWMLAGESARFYTAALYRIIARRPLVGRLESVQEISDLNRAERRWQKFTETMNGLALSAEQEQVLFVAVSQAVARMYRYAELEHI